MAYSQDTVRVEIDRIATETDAAYLVEVDGEEVWLPKSQVQHIDEDEVWIPRWLAEEKELEHD